MRTPRVHLFTTGIAIGYGWKIAMPRMPQAIWQYSLHRYIQQCHLRTKPGWKAERDFTSSDREEMRPSRVRLLQLQTHCAGAGCQT